ncbi:arginine--tRNA ligase [Candidatus Parcubacteria bacterium]|nr:arginine--tRNA ligase [Candidatus Parcubacteria bacterium]
MNKGLASQINLICRQLFEVEAEVVLSRPDEQFGDFSCNVAMQLAGKLSKNPREIAESIAAELNKKDVSAEIAGPGFINIRLSDQAVFEAAQEATKLDQPLKKQAVVAEYSDPNPFKVLHAGHLYTSFIGDAISNILETAGAKVHRVNYGGDVGLHVAKTMWGILNHAGSGQLNEQQAVRNINSISGNTLAERAAIMAIRYIEGNRAYEENPEAKADIAKINARVYELHDKNDRDSDFAQVYWTCRDWSYDYFKEFYKEIGVKEFEKFYPESQTVSLGVSTVKAQTKKGVYEESNGAIVFKGEKYGLHTRVFINSQGLPTYETKEVGLIMTKWNEYSFDKSVIITGNDIVEYMKVVQKSIEQFAPELVKKSVHLTHGQVKLEGGKKMSSRKGNVLYANDVIEAAQKASEANGRGDKDIVIGSVRYSFLKNRVGGDIIYDPKESVAQEGNSGPYLQYALVRAKSILHKLKATNSKSQIPDSKSLDKFERSLARQLSLYPEAFDAALKDYSPHHICSYLYELAQIFNRFYENSRVAGDPRESLRTNLVQSYERVLSRGLDLLGMPTPEKM